MSASPRDGIVDAAVLERGGVRGNINLVKVHRKCYDMCSKFRPRRLPPARLMNVEENVEIVSMKHGPHICLSIYASHFRTDPETASLQRQ